MEGTYIPPIALTVVSGVFLCLGAIAFVVVAADIIWHKGWQSMMWIMIPVYPINAAYNPLSTYIYFKYGRPKKPVTGQAAVKSCHTAKEVPASKEKDLESLNSTPSQTQEPKQCCHKSDNKAPSPTDTKPAPSCHTETRPYLATVLVGVSHCGAGCVLGDLVGEWLVYGTNTTINGASIWPCLLIDYAFALFFGIVFQYFSIAPMSGEYGPLTVWRAAKADILSLTSFEVGAFGWMIAYQVGIFGGRLGMDTWTYWWMMQVGMCMGFATGVPVNWFLLKWGVKEPCC